jgi:5'-nucleotidase
MFDTPIDLAKARILLSNDDGIRAPGLDALERVARSLTDDVWIVAPELEQSGASHSLTLRRPLRIKQYGERRFSVDGTPSDAVLLGIKHIMKDKRPALVLSGINAGGNAGEDIIYSGTVAVAMEATLLDLPAIAFSQFYASGAEPRWDTAETYAPEVIRRLVAAPWPRNTMVNVNFPDLPPDAVAGIVVARQGRRKIGDNLEERIDPRGVPYYWIGPTRDEAKNKLGTDISAVRAGAVAVTPVYLDFTHMPALEELRKIFP